jgi:hypothetical protein
MEEVVQDEVAADAGGSVDNIAVGREEVADVTCLENEKDNPAYNVSGDVGEGRTEPYQKIEVMMEF